MDATVLITNIVMTSSHQNQMTLNQLSYTNNITRLVILLSTHPHNSDIYTNLQPKFATLAIAINLAVQELQM